MIKQSLQQKQTQRLSPIQIQTIKLIETPIQELEQAVRNEWESNPVLDDESPEKDREDYEEGNVLPKQVSIEDIKEDDSIPGYRLHVNNWGKDERPEYNTFSIKESFTDSLLEQLGFKNLTSQEERIGAFLIGSLDGDGYLRRDTDSLIDDLAFRENIETDEREVERILNIIQEFDPAGVGARNLRECLLLQLRRSRRTPETDNAIEILTHCFDNLTSRHYQKIMARLSLSPDELKAALARITKLSPAPGDESDTTDDQSMRIVPDFRLRPRQDGKLEMDMPRFPIPEVKVKRKYVELLETAKSTTDRQTREAATFVKQKIDSAKWYVEALKQRHNTLEKTMQAIIDFQQEYFTDGDETKLKPMVLKDIAEKTGFDISTISRVVSSKYIDTHFGILPLKYFFSEGLTAQSGEEVSSRELKKALSECVNNEDKRHPLTDDDLVERMTALGYKVARRTIAKYRDQLGISKASLRKEL